MKPTRVYACYSLDEDVRLSSSSGAVFSSLAEYVFEQYGVVYGVAMSDDCYSAEYISVTDKKGLVRLRGSKYLQAKVGNTYRKVKEDLLSGKIVLFTGTGCQVNGLKNFLGKEYDNLICVDVICHGVPSPALWRKYAKYQEEKNGGKIRGINFRCKDDSWTDFGMKEVLENISQESQSKLFIPKDNDSFMRMFLRDYCLRPSCYNCVAKSVKMADLTIADFWGINDVAPEMNDGKGTSLVLIRTDNGENVFNEISNRMKLKKVSYEDGVKRNPAEFRSCTKPQQRDTFFDDMRMMGFAELEKKYASPAKITVKGKIKRKIKNTIKLVHRVIGGGSEYKHNEEYGLLFVFRV